MRKIAQSVSAMDWALGHLSDVDVRYEKEHPEIADKIKELMVALTVVQSATEHLREAF